MNVRSKTLKIRNLPKGNKRIDCINSKPFVFFIIAFVMGIVLIFMRNFMLGGILLTLSLYNFLFIKNERLVEFYDDYVVFYHINPQKDECFLLFWEDVLSWQCKRNHTDYDELEVILRDHKHVTLKCVGKHKIVRYFKRFVFSQEEGVCRQKM